MSLLRMLIENVRSLHAAITSNDYAVNVYSPHKIV